jgi:hypothetical protein
VTTSHLQVADLATFLLITLFPQTPFVLYFAYIQPVIFPVDPIVGTMMLLCLVSLLYYCSCLRYAECDLLVHNYQIYHFCAGFLLLRLIIRSQTAQFMRLCESDEHED